MATLVSCGRSQRGKIGTVEGDDRHVVRDVPAGLGNGLVGTERDSVVEADQRARVGIGREQAAHGVMTGFGPPQRLDQTGQLRACRRQFFGDAGETLATGDDARRVLADEVDPVAVTSFQQVRAAERPASCSSGTTVAMSSSAVTQFNNTSGKRRTVIDGRTTRVYIAA